MPKTEEMSSFVLSSTPIPVQVDLSDSDTVSETEDLSESIDEEDEKLAKYMDMHSLNVYRRACTRLDLMKAGRSRSIVYLFKFVESK